MPEYITPLPALLAGFIEAAINRVLALDDASLKRIQRLAGKILQVDLQGVGITLFFTFQYGSVQVSLDSEAEPDTVVTGTPLALFAMAAPEDAGDWGLPGSGVQISGNANLARDLGNLFSKLQADWESPLAAMFGDVLGFQIASGIRQGGQALKRGAEVSADAAREHVRQGNSSAVGKKEVSQFNNAVDDLRDGVARLQARVKALQEQDT